MFNFLKRKRQDDRELRDAIQARIDAEKALHEATKQKIRAEARLQNLLRTWAELDALAMRLERDNRRLRKQLVRDREFQAQLGNIAGEQ